VSSVMPWILSCSAKTSRTPSRIAPRSIFIARLALQSLPRGPTPRLVAPRFALRSG
jgi:hypothetical protein